MNLSSYVSKDMVTVNLRASTSRAAITEIVGHISSRRPVANRNELLQAILAREEAASTGIGDGVAIPHARLPHIDTVLFFIGISKPGIDFGAPDGKAAHIVILFVTPEAESQTHLKILSAIGNLEKNRELLSKITNAASDIELFQILNFEQVQRESYSPLSIEEVLRELESRESGLSDDEVRKLAEIHGPNHLLLLGTTPLIGRFLRYIFSFPNLLPWIAAVIAMVASFYWIGAAILLAVLINAAASYLREFKTDRSVEALKTLIPPASRVVRDGKERRIATENLVPGDVLLLDAGDVIAADGRLIETEELCVDNAPFSGDHKPIYKSTGRVTDREQFLWLEIPSLVFAGTSVVSGSGKAVVTATGMSTELGQVAYLTQTIKNEPSAFERELTRLFRFSTAAGFLFVALAAVLYLFAAEGILSVVTARTETAVIGLLLAAAPMGILPLVTLSLYAAARRIRRRGAVVKKLSSIDALGGLNVICTDKTGTLTTNEMSVEELWLDGRSLQVSGYGYEPDGAFHEGDAALTVADLSREPFRLLFLVSVLCSNAELLPPDAGGGKWRVVGDPTEGALLVLAAKGGSNIREIRAESPPLRRFAFDSIRKRMSSIHLLTLDGAQEHGVLVKGAPHELLRLCTRRLAGGRERALDEEAVDAADSRIDELAASGMRVLGFAYRRISASEAEEATVDAIERELTFIGVAAMVDPPRADAAEAIRTCRRAGVRVVMVTGEYQLTALAIARQLGMVSGTSPRVVTGTEISGMTADELRQELAEEGVVFARVNPEHRLRIVEGLQAMGNVVAATGDGIADAPTLKQANIGVAMGRRGTEVTRATAEIELTDDSFASIVQAVHVGRAIFVHCERIARFALAHILPQAFAFFLFLILGVPLPLALAQLPVIDLAIELPIGLAIGLSPFDPSVMTHPARRRRRMVDRGIVLHSFLWLGTVSTLSIGIGFLVAVAIGSPVGAFDPSSAGIGARSVYFASIAASQLAVFFSVRRGDRSAFGRGGRLNPLLPISIAASIALLLLLLYVPFFERVFQTARLTLPEWGVVAGVGVVALLLEEARKLVRRRQGEGWDEV